MSPAFPPPLTPSPPPPPITPESYNNIFNIGSNGEVIKDLPSGCGYYRVTVNCPGTPRDGTIKWYTKGESWQPAGARLTSSTEMVYSVNEHAIGGAEPNLTYIVKIPQGHTQIKFVMSGFTPGEIYVGGDPVVGP